MLVAGLCRLLLGAMHGYVCGLPKVNDVAIGIAMMLFGTGLAFFFGKPYIQPSAPRLPSIPSASGPTARSLASRLAGEPAVLRRGSRWRSRWPGRSANTRLGLLVRIVGDSAAAARAMGVSVDRVRFWRPRVGGFLAGVGGAFLSLYYPGSWNEGLSSGQGLMAVALVVFARWNPVRCITAALLFGAAGALGPSLQSIGITWGYYFFNAAPYILTLVIMIAIVLDQASHADAPASCRSRAEQPEHRA